jgi:hypothetical protein
MKIPKSHSVYLLFFTQLKLNFKMKKIIILIIFSSFISFQSFSQPITEWEKKLNYTHEDNLLDFVTLADGSFLGIGTTELTFRSSIFEYACYKFDCNGNIKWIKKFPDRIITNEFIMIDTMDKEKLFVYGYIGRAKDTIVNYVGSVSIIDTAGNILKNREFSGNGPVSVSKIISNNDQTFTVVVNSIATDNIFQGNKGLRDIWLLKMDKDLNILSKKNIGGSGNDFGATIIKLKDNNYILVGGTTSRDGDIKAVYSGQDAFVMKLTNNFDILWSTTFGGNQSEFINDVIEMPDRGLIVGGGSDSYDGAFQGQPKGFYSDAFVARINPSGGVSWVRSLGVDKVKNPQYVVWPPSLLPIDSTNFLVNTSGKTDEGLLNSINPVPWLLKMNTKGETVWKKSYGTQARLLWYQSNRMRMLSDRSLLLVGQREDSLSNGRDFSLFKLSPLTPDKTDECGKLVLYPNPTAKDVKLKTAEYFLPNSSVKVIDVLGRNVFNGVIGKNCQEFEVELPASLSMGMYFLQIESVKNCTLPFVKGQ